MQGPTVFLWRDIGYLVEAKPSADGVFFSAWPIRPRRYAEEYYFQTAKGDLVADHHKAIPLLSGRTGAGTCLDLLFESMPLHFCDIKQAAGIGELIQRLYSLEKNG